MTNFEIQRSHVTQMWMIGSSDGVFLRKKLWWLIVAASDYDEFHKTVKRHMLTIVPEPTGSSRCFVANLTAKSLRWSENTPVLDCDSSFITPLPELVSFEALQPLSLSLYIYIYIYKYSVSKYIYELCINVICIQDI